MDDHTPDTDTAPAQDEPDLEAPATTPPTGPTRSAPTAPPTAPDVRNLRTALAVLAGTTVFLLGSVVGFTVAHLCDPAPPHLRPLDHRMPHRTPMGGHMMGGHTGGHMDGPMMDGPMMDGRTVSPAQPPATSSPGPDAPAAPQGP